MKECRQSLLEYFAQKGRSLPWRSDKDPYRVAVSEIMLQQTRISAVIPKYEAFLKAFPNWLALASAPLDSVYKAWEGLGYYARAKNLQKAAQIIVNEYNQDFPKTAKEIAKLPGFGAYASAAIASFCFREKAVAVDGNLARIYARLETVALPANDATLKKQANDYFLAFMGDENPGQINEALMEVGELLCLPNGEPLCSSCPLLSMCKAYQKGEQLSYPKPQKKAARKVETKTVLVFEYQGKFAIEKRGKGDVLSSLYGFPMEKGKKSLGDLKKEYPNARISKLGNDRFLFTHKEWDMVAYRLDLDKPLPNLAFYTLEQIQNELTLPRAFAFVFKELTK